MSNIPKSVETELQQEIAELIGNSFGPLLKFDANSGKFTVGGKEVAIGREYIAHVDLYARGWTKFADKRPEQIGLFPGPNSSPSITTTASSTSPMGLHIRPPTSYPRCGSIIAFITAGSGPHYASQRRIPPCGRGLSSSSWCEVEFVQGVWTCLACNSIASGNITVPSSWRC